MQALPFLRCLVWSSPPPCDVDPRTPVCQGCGWARMDSSSGSCIWGLPEHKAEPKAPGRRAHTRLGLSPVSVFPHRCRRLKSGAASGCLLLKSREAGGVPAAMCPHLRLLVPSPPHTEARWHVPPQPCLRCPPAHAGCTIPLTAGPPPSRAVPPADPGPPCLPWYEEPPPEPPP